MAFVSKTDCLGIADSTSVVCISVDDGASASVAEAKDDKSAIVASTVYGETKAPRDIVRLNAFGVRVERDCRVEAMCVLPRCACLGGRVVLREPTIGADIWLSRAMRWADDKAETFAFLRALSLWAKPEDLPDPDDIDKVTGAVNRFARDVVGEFTIRELDAALSYVEDGDSHLDGEACPKREEDEADGEVVTGRGEHSFAVGLLMDGVFFRLGSVEDLRAMTVSQLEALVAMAVRRERGSTKDEHAERIGEYYRVLDEVMSNSSPAKASCDKKDKLRDQNDDPNHEVERR